MKSPCFGIFDHPAAPASAPLTLHCQTEDPWQAAIARQRSYGVFVGGKMVVFYGDMVVFYGDMVVFCGKMVVCGFMECM